MTSMYELPTEFIILGAGGHALVLKALADAAGMSVVGVSDPRLHAADVALQSKKKHSAEIYDCWVLFSTMRPSLRMGL